MRGVVPVLKRPMRNPSWRSDSVSPTAGSSPKRAARILRSPMWHSPFRKVPVVRMTARAVSSPVARADAVADPVAHQHRLRRALQQRQVRLLLEGA
jgi:hypothetical protein